MQCYHMCTNTRPWTSPRLQALDDTLEEAGSTPVLVPCHDLALEADGEHFTREGLVAFATVLAQTFAQVHPARDTRDVTKLFLLSDSTVDHHNWDANGEYTGWATRVVQDAFKGHAHMPEVHVDAVCGSGFVACCDDGAHFGARLSRWITEQQETKERNHESVVLLVGGWNDVWDIRASLMNDCARRLVHRVRNKRHG